MKNKKLKLINEMNSLLKISERSKQFQLFKKWFKKCKDIPKMPGYSVISTIADPSLETMGGAAAYYIFTIFWH